MLKEQANITIRGVDGVEWHIHGPRSIGSPVRLREGAVGELFDAPFSTVYRGVAGKPGKSFRGINYAERNVVLRLNIAGDTGGDWARVDSRFRRSLSAEREFQLICDTELSGRRWLNVRLAEAPEVENNLDPHEQANMQMQVVVVAANPFWQSQPIRDEFVFDGSNWASDGVTVTNPGDIPVWPKWVLTAPAKYGLPDIDLSTPVDARLDRFVYLPFQPHGREVLVDTDPFEEMITTNDGTLLWAQMNGQFFQNQLPPHLPETQLPVYVDPFPLLPFDLPTTWRIWIGEKLEKLVDAIGLSEFLALTPEDIAEKITEWINGVKPDWLDPIIPDVAVQLTFDFIARIIRETYGRIGNIAGATAQIIVEPQHTRPWGG
ncbi:phage tail family protein [Corynebacterium amycolatum]|uniref:Phage tail family protein n=1 Tax=Corynebacterium amycolatum TaxID=43765 RepID=A0AB37G5T0_CORAY|nr:phage tail domain-containing protein [Corynebacterium amycolatum]QPR30028.1 phage tail family protein [Corynebacterium amycolatum]QQB81867.1 phage tail family protein [Corynebacterium amycolatum]